MSDSLVLNGKVYLLRDLADRSGDPAISDHERRVLQFAQAWLSGRETFTVHTSGSTGQPKAIPLTREQMVTSANLTCRALGIAPGDRAFVCVSVEFIAGMMMLVRGFEMGLDITIVDPVSRPLAALPADSRFDLTAMVPLQLHETLQGGAHERAILNAMQGILIGGAPVSMALAQQLQQIEAPMYHTYGMTETVSHIALKRLNGPERSDCFRPFDGVDLGLDERGCLRIVSALTRGETLQTNDLAELYADGSFRWLGRIDNVINSGGVKVQTEKVETALEAWLLAYQGGAQANRRFFVGALAHARLGQAVVAVIEGRPFEDQNAASPGLENTLRQHLQQVLTAYEVPRKVYFIDKLIETPTGKIDRRSNLEHIATHFPLPG
jgi:O-succinylbenzoic acid--CoA ligase